MYDLSSILVLQWTMCVALGISFNFFKPQFTDFTVRKMHQCMQKVYSKVKILLIYENGIWCNSRNIKCSGDKKERIDEYTPTQFHPYFVYDVAYSINSFLFVS